jgi:WD40 repeat protein
MHGAMSRRPQSAALMIVCAACVSLWSISQTTADEWASSAARRELERKFDATFFDPRRDASAEAAQARLSRLLKTRIEAIHRACGLSEAQAAKLELAGRAVIKRLFEKLSAEKQEFLSKPRDDLTAARYFYESPAILELRSKFRNGPFDDESPFAKSISNVLTPEQAVKYADRSARAKSSNRTITAANVGDLVRIAKMEKDVHQVGFNRDGTQLGLVEYKKQLDIHLPFADEPVRTLGQGKGVFGFDFGPQGDLVATVDDSDIATVLNLSDGKELRIPTGQKQYSVMFSPDGKTLVTAGYGTKAHLWSTATGELIREFALGRGDGGLTPMFSPDGQLLAIGNRNSMTGLFDVASGKLLRTLQRRSSHGLKFDPTGQTLAVVYVNGELVLWDVQTETVKKSVRAWANELFTVDWTPDGSMLVTGGHNAPLTFWNATDLSIAAEFESPERIFSARFSPDGTKLIFSGWNPDPEHRYVETWAVP